MTSETRATPEQLRDMTDQELWGLFDDQSRELMKAVIPDYSHNLHLTPKEFATFVRFVSITKEIDPLIQNAARILYDRRTQEKKIENVIENVVDVSMFGGAAVIILTGLSNLPENIKADILSLDIGSLTIIAVLAIIALRRVK